MINLHLLAKFILCIITLIAFSSNAMDDQRSQPCNQAPSADCPLQAMPQQTTVTLPVPRPMSPGALTRKVLELEQQNRAYQLALQEQATLIQEQAERIQQQDVRAQKQDELLVRYSRMATEHEKSIATLVALPERLGALQDQIAGHVSGIATQAQSITTHTQQLSVLQGQVAGNSTTIAERSTWLVALTGQLAIVQQEIATQWQSIMAHTQQIGALQGQFFNSTRPSPSVGFCVRKGRP